MKKGQLKRTKNSEQRTENVRKTIPVLRSVFSFLSSRTAGFTLVEIMIVVVIIGILISIVAVSGGTARARARDVRRKEDLRQIQSGVETYFQATRQYPSMQDSWRAEDGLTALVPQFLVTVPDDPRPQSDTVSRFYAYQATDGTSNVLAPATGASRYRLLAGIELEGDVDQPTVLCSFLVSTSQNPPFCGEGEMTLIQTGGALWDNALWGDKSF